MPKLRLQFGSLEPEDGVIVDWQGSIESFPLTIRFRSDDWEWSMYDRDKTGQCDYVMLMTSMPYWQLKKSVSQFLGNLKGAVIVYDPKAEKKCHCGARKTSFAFDHMRFCDMHDPAFFTRA